MKELSEIIQELRDNTLSQIDVVEAIQYTVEAYESGMEKARTLISNEEYDEQKTKKGTF